MHDGVSKMICAGIIAAGQELGRVSRRNTGRGRAPTRELLEILFFVRSCFGRGVASKPSGEGNESISTTLVACELAFEHRNERFETVCHQGDCIVFYKSVGM